MPPSESPTDTWIRDPSDPPITDQYGNSWRLSRSGQVVIDGEHDRSTSGVREMVYLNRAIWQFTDQRLWWYKTGPTAPWLPLNGTPDAPFGPTSDPRLETIQATLSALAVEVTRATSILAGAIQNVQNDVDEIPREVIPDPRIDTLAAALGTATAQVIQGQHDLTLRLASLEADIVAGLIETISRLDANLAAINDQTKIDKALAELHRIIVMLLQLFPQVNRPTIVADQTNARHTRTQAAPLTPGP